MSEPTPYLLGPGGPVLGVDHASGAGSSARRSRAPLDRGGVQVGGGGSARRHAGLDSCCAARALRTSRRSESEAYFAPSDPIGPLLCAAVTRSLAPQIVAHGIASEAELGLETLQKRIAEQVGALDA